MSVQAAAWKSESGSALTYLRDVWKCRFFWLSLVRCDLQTRYRRSVLGMGWSLLHPLAMTTVLCVVFHGAINLPWREYAPLLLTGLSFWAFLTNASMQGCLCFFSAEAYIRQYPTPMAVFPLRVVLGAGFHFLLATGVVIAMIAAFKGIAAPIALLSLVPTLLLMFLFGWAIATILGCFCVHFPDLQHITEVLLQMLFYITPVLYPARMLLDNGLAWVLHFNPLVTFLTLLRDPLLDGVVPTPMTYLKGFFVVAIFAAVASVVLAKSQRRLVYYL